MKIINSYVNVVNDTVYKFDHGYFAVNKKGVLKVYTNKCNPVAKEIYRLAEIAILRLTSN